MVMNVYPLGFTVAQLGHVAHLGLDLLLLLALDFMHVSLFCITLDHYIVFDGPCYVLGLSFSGLFVFFSTFGPNALRLAAFKPSALWAF